MRVTRQDHLKPSHNLNFAVLAACLVAFAILLAPSPAPAAAVDQASASGKASASALTGAQRKAKQKALRKCRKIRKKVRRKACVKRVNKRFRKLAKKQVKKPVTDPVQIGVFDDYFAPSSVTIRKGESVKWVWDAANRNAHNVNIMAPFPAGLTAVERFNLNTPGAPVTDYTFGPKALNRTGTYNFVCSLHAATMTMRVTVTD